MDASLLPASLTRSKLLHERVVIEPRGFGFSARINQTKNPPVMSFLFGEPTSIFLEHLFDDLFRLRDSFKALGMVLKEGEVYLPDLGDVQ